MVPKDVKEGKNQQYTTEQMSQKSIVTSNKLQWWVAIEANQDMTEALNIGQEQLQRGA